jgi:tetratricopeptide (TPR) repeat protein
MASVDYGSKRFLIVDNIKQSRDTLKIFAYSLGVHAVDTSYHAPDLFALCESNNYDVVLLGYDLGENRKNGQQILEELRNKTLVSRECIVIMITAEVSQAMVLAALEHKPDEYLIKPYTIKDLRTRLDRCLEKKRVMQAIYRAMDAQQAEQVISLCDYAIRNGTPYKCECLGIKARQLFELKDYQKAKKIYDAYLGSPNCQWAAIGLGKIALIEEQYDKAEKLFNAIIDDNPFYLSAYDWLAKKHELTGNKIKAEEVLEEALMVSPRSVQRLKHYAELCIENESFDKATQALSRTNDLAYHSVHRDPDNAIQFAESLLEHADALSEFQVKKLNHKVFNVLNNMTKDFKAGELKVVSAFLTARLHQKANDHALVKATIKDAERLLGRYKDQLSTSGTFNVAKSLIALNRQQKANGLLDQLAQRHPDDMEILSQVVALENRPISEKDKQAAQAALETGISLYKAKHYVLAIDKLNQALYHFPNHIGVKLNLLQVLLVSFEKDHSRVSDFKQARVLIKQFRSLAPDSESYKRFLKLRGKFEALSTFVDNVNS